MAVRHISHARYELWYHIAFSTKYRKKIWRDEVTKQDVATIFRTIALHYDMEIGTIELLPDHIHLTISAPPNESITSTTEEKMPRKITAGGLCQLGQLVVSGFSQPPNREQIQTVLGNSAAATILNEAGIKLEALLASQSGNVARPTPASTGLLEFVTNVQLLGTEAFMASDFYKESAAPSGIKFWLGSNFQGLVAQSQSICLPPMPLKVQRLRKSASAAVITKAVGEAGRFASFAEAAASMAELLKKQSQGENGPLLTNGYATLFPYPEGVADCSWDSSCRGWFVNAYPLGGPRRWGGGGRVVSR